ncbi:MAG: hypothetical protein KatS3mg089_0222 [Patescibacteria group bacterium]|nr:MAG: hypothetical protein KatS3mg089_0222 [Patescibacteria group bacterium]
MNKEKLLAYLKAIWPRVYRLINGALYFVLNLIRSIIIFAYKQIRGEM